MKTLVERFTSTDEGMRLFQQEKLILEFTELICGLLDERKFTLTTSRIWLASQLDWPLATLTKVLDGETIISLRAASDLAHALGKTLEIKAVPLTIHPQPGEPAK